MAYLRYLLRGCLALFLLDFYVDGTIVIPEEVPSFLSIVYSNIPPIKKGTDSRLGFGFRLGPNADVQIQLELGPQSNTQPIGPNAEVPGSAASTKKRQTEQQQSKDKIPVVVVNNNGQWIDSWKSSLMTDSKLDKEKLSTFDPTRREAGIVNHLRQLYKEIDTNKETSR